jgi:hypothetical protein
MPPYRDPYADDNELDDADLGNDYKEGDELPEPEEFESSVEDDESEVEATEDADKDTAEEETEDNEEEEETADETDSDTDSEDGSDEGEETDETEEDEEDDGGAGVTENQVPQSRFNEVNGNWRRAEERAERLEALLEQTIQQLSTTATQAQIEEPDITVDVAAVEKEILELAFAGREEEAVQKRVELDAYKELVWADKYGAGAVEETVTTALNKATEQTKLQEVVQSTQALYPELQEGNDAYDQLIVNEINEIWDGLATRMPISAALQKAVDLVTKSRGMSSDQSEETAPKSQKKSRKKAAVKKNAEAQKRQPPKMRGRSANESDLDQIRASKLSDDQLFSMSEKELRSLRGD